MGVSKEVVKVWPKEYFEKIELVTNILKIGSF